MVFGKKEKIELFRTSFTLFIIAAVVAILLSVVNHFTKPIVLKKGEERINNALSLLFEEADHFELIKSLSTVVKVQNESVPVQEIYSVKDSDGITLGYCIRVTPYGYSDIVDMMVALDVSDVVVGAEILSISDTPGVGTKIQTDTDFQKSLLGINNTVIPVKKSPSSKREVQVIAGATVSSKAYINGINAALEVAQELE